VVCSQCREESSAGHLNYLGFFCSTECARAFADGRERLHAELLREEAALLPLDVTVSDFERFALRLAVQYLATPRAKLQLPEWARAPEILALRIKELVLQHLPAEYLRIERNPSPFPPDYIYRFTTSVPSQIVLKAAETAGVLATEAC
jgi:hypothetical protein